MTTARWVVASTFPDPAGFDLVIERGITFLPLIFTFYDDLPPPPFGEGTGVLVPLNGYTPHAHARKTADKSLVFNLRPIILGDPANAQVKIGPFTDEETLTLALLNGVWDLVLENPSGDWLPPVVGGRFTIKNQATRNEG